MRRFFTTRKRLYCILSALLLCFSLCSAPGTSLASGTPEPVYQITETELATLESNLARLSAINSKLQLESKTQNTQVAQLQEQLRLLQSQLTALRQESEKQQALLMKANKSLAEYATEAKRTRLRIKAQRNTWTAISIGLGILALSR